MYKELSLLSLTDKFVVSQRLGPHAGHSQLFVIFSQNSLEADADMFFLRIKIRTVAFGWSIRVTSQLAPTFPA